jgi:hypothetical protein
LIGATDPFGPSNVDGPPQQKRDPMTDQQPQIDATLRALPSHGWTAGWVGRRDRALIVLSQVMVLPFRQVALLTAGEVSIADGTATIHAHGEITACQRVDDSQLCGPCALARWIHVLDLAVTSSNRLIAAVIARAAPLAPDSPHLCAHSPPISEATRAVALLPPIDQWGLLTAALPTPDPHPAFPLCCADPTGKAAAVRAVQPPLPKVNQPLASVDHSGSENRAPFDVGLRTHQLERRAEQLLDPAPATPPWHPQISIRTNAAFPDRSTLPV